MRRLVQALGTAGLIVVVGASAALAASVTVTPNRDSVNHPGGIVTYTLEVACDDPVGDCTLNSLEDSLIGDLNGVGTCEATGQTFSAASPYSCQFSRFVGGPIGSSQTRTVTAMGLDELDADFAVAGASGSATVTVGRTPFSGLKELITAYVHGRVRSSLEGAGLPVPEGISPVTQTLSRSALRIEILRTENAQEQLRTHRP